MKLVILIRMKKYNNEEIYLLTYLSFIIIIIIIEGFIFVCLI